MTSMETLLAYIKKLNHPIKEIRERSLKLLLAKLRLGWEFEDELGGTRDLLEALLAWLDVQKPSLQKEALELLLTIVKTRGGAYICKEYGTKKILSTLEKIKEHVDTAALDMLEDVMESVSFMNTVDSQVNVGVPPLSLNSEISSDTRSGYYNLDLQKESSRETSISNNTENLKDNYSDGINCLLFPWVDLSSSDMKTIVLIEDSLKLLKSTRRCCRFIRDVFLRDFPAEIFLNRPTIIKSLLAISDRQCGGHPGEALQVLLSVTECLHSRLLQLYSSDLVSDLRKISVTLEESEDRVNAHLEQITENDVRTPRPDALLVLKQLPLPIYVLEATNAVLTIMARSVVAVEIGESNDIEDLKEVNICLCLAKSLIGVLLESVNVHFWSMDHNSKTHRDIAHKTCIVMRTLGDLITKYGKSFNDDPEKLHHRVVWLRLIVYGERLLMWARDSTLPPSTLVKALQMAQVDPHLDLLYPSLSRSISNVLMTAKSSVDHEYKSRYKELTKLYDSMDHAVQFMITKDSSKNTENILKCIQNSLPILQLNVDRKYFKEMATVLLDKAKILGPNDDNWTTVRNISLTLMAHNVERVRVMFYKMLADMVKSVFLDDSSDQSESEKCLTLICHVEILTEICCQGLSSNQKDVASSAAEIMLCLVRGRLVLSEGGWWRLLASLLPVLPLLHAHAAHETQLGKAICKSLEADIVECMGVSNTEMVAGLVRLLFVNCAAVQLDAARSLCQVLDDSQYLPPRESIRTDVIMNALRRVEPQNFNIDESSSPSKNPMTTGVVQILEVLKQDLVLNEERSEYISEDRGISQPTLEPSLRRSTLQQLAVMMRQQEFHDAFLQYDGLTLIVSLLRLSLMVDDYLAFPECAISCVSILNSVGFISRHVLAKISDLPLLLLRVILVFPANDSNVLMAAQVLALVVWAGFMLQELDSTRRKVAALPLSVTQRTLLPFPVNSYWNTSPNTEHSRVDWLISEESWRNAVYFRWWWVSAGGAGRPAHGLVPGPPAPLISLVSSCARSLLALENATSHQQVRHALGLLQSYLPLLPLSSTCPKEFGSLPWGHTKRFLRSSPASSKDIELLIALLQFIISYMDNVPNEDGSMSWIKSSFIGNDASILSLLSRDRLYPQQTPQEDIELTQLRILIVKVLLRCIILVEKDGDYSSNKMESLLKILLACLDMVDLKNFHMLGYLNELMRCIRYGLHSRYCNLSEDVLIQCLSLMTSTLSGCASGSGRKGQGCRFDAMLALLALLKQLHENNVPIQRWSEAWSGEVIRAVVHCSGADRAELRAAAVHACAELARHAQLLPYLRQCLPNESLVQHALELFCAPGEANVVRSAAATLLTTITARRSSHSQVFEREILQAISDTNFIEECLHIFVDFCSKKEYKFHIEPNVPVPVFERGAELEVRAQKCGDIRFSPTYAFQRPPPTPMLVAAVADVIHNISTYKTADVRAWNEQGLYRILFRCASWPGDESAGAARVRGAACRALAAAPRARPALAATNDCLLGLLASLTHATDGTTMESDMGVFARTQSLFLLASLLTEPSASETVWLELMKEHSEPFFYMLLQSMETENSELQKAAIYCLSQLTRSTSHKKLRDKSKDESCLGFFENLKCPYEAGAPDLWSAGDSGRFDCQPEYMTESFCKVLMGLFQQLYDSKKCSASQDENWTQVCSCLCSLLSLSGRGRRFSVHRYFPRQLLLALQAVRDSLSLQGKPAEVIRNANNDPVLETLRWLLMLMSCCMLECPVAKDRFAEEHVELSLSRLWAWCMMTDALREAVMNLLVNFTNDCSKAWACACVCVGGRCLAGEVSALCAREAVKPRPAAILSAGLRVLRQCAAHHHCRAIILKSEVVQCAVRMCASRTAGASCACAEACALCECLCARADGAAAVARALSGPAPRRLLPALAHAAHHLRAHFLQTPDLLELLSGALLTGDISEVVSAARAAWALAANNHRAKLVLRSAGISSAVQSTLQRLQRAREEPAAQRALELLAYTDTVLQAT